MRKLIAGMKLSVDGRIEGPEGYADWVDAWSEDYGLTDRIDACLLGSGMYPGYEGYWTAIRDRPDQPLPMTGKLPLPAEVDWGRKITDTPHYVLSSRLTSAEWPSTRFLRSADEVAELKKQPGKDIYLMGGAQITASLFDAGLVDELRLILYPLLAGTGKPLFGTNEVRRPLRLADVGRLSGGRLRLSYVAA